MNSFLKPFAMGILAFSFLGLAFAETPGVVVDIKMSPAGDFQVKTNDVKGNAHIEGNKVKAEDIRVNLTKVQTGKEVRDKHTKDYLKTAEYPEAILVRAEGEGGKGTGVIKIKGIEKQINGTYTLLENNTFLKAQFPLHLPDFKIENINFMGQGVQNDVVLTVIVPIAAAAAKRPAPTAAAPAATAPAKQKAAPKKSK